VNESCERTSFLDLLMATLVEHEKTLSEMVEKLEKVCKRLERVTREVENA